MLAAMPPTPPPPPEPGEARIRDRGDACPGALRLHPADDGRLARLRLPAGRLTDHQAEVLARAAETLGDGRISITSRGNAELRGLADDCGAELAALLAGAGLLPSPTHERVRNIVASPASGLDGLGYADVQLWARALDTALCAEPRAASLSGRFLFLLDDGRGDVAGLGGDVSLVAGPGGTVLLWLGARVFRLAADDAVRAALTAALAFLDAAEAAGNGAWRPRELPEGHEPDWAGALARAGIPAEPVPAPPLPASPPPPPGPLGERALHVLAPLGRLTAAQLRALLPADEIRLTPWRGAVVTTEPGRLAALEAHGLITRPDAPLAGVTACTGRPGCAKSLADVRADALAAPPGPGPVHFSGCARRCGHPYGAWTGVLATGDDTYLVDGAPTPRTSLTAAVAAARGLPTHTR
ncbi:MULTISPECIES: cobalamin biosynthesis protein CobG [unclassified Streptomyces]|uniref:cobalamin biosynthesis protein CobG n=1 Tax=unclassified Streptomyces TaxID=2593676 RepID=UPI0006F99625|nr:MULTISPECIES: cobalamin biosynthesis protein CobG [unclassified Streptomyces]KQX49665.1 cobalamin biosynthesis protein CobG [Streptomyces sp. Root1304]KRA79281.1 cobalamin biosynthesis protein CobG [Streptomyces sp. Root66D1]